MLIRYFIRPSRIKELRTNPGGQLLEGFAEELSQNRLPVGGSAQTHSGGGTFSALDRPSKVVAH